MSNTLTNEAHQRSLKDFLTLYNTITEYCFNKCVSNFNERSASGSETTCVDVCTDSYVQYNQRFMFNFVDHQERRKRDLESAAIEAAQKEAEAAASGTATLPDAQTLELSQEGALQQAAQLLESMSSSSGAAGSSVDGAGSSVDQGVFNNPTQSSLTPSDSTPV
ncbi:mitochondrial import inner membrane translocase subunit Tim10B-like [Physella acuta]|uniref:mitochondrial import inner membrane translocase subunit Tim10B-like n=1 Tax=Physella acuta TaxID=109671 RepID=UPI0027DE411C|nr:mitochondrial import inner membrane translocase subunit Tim10B-like [Physella acuta]XP_059158843.1 mitochondrial import inner membrane translocase subunit Tim10B-like [Physella acuta]XP_059158844.1 mitochondrial import inner membrane translocase subunit Tim10B-like [Physella acuta]XP_059158846.1 mitochondrial import inner membrane translocase subunit Tim10B-like [Physella acuta]XP_059158847.1 mitochondrial import inner membrane translocase subunit Tim10B-like [Physella acuta]